MTYAKQTCAYITQRSGRDATRLRFIQLLLHSVRTYSHGGTVFECSVCRGYSDCKFSEDHEVVKEPKLQRFLEQTFGVRADATLPSPPPSQRKRVRAEDHVSLPPVEASEDGEAAAEEGEEDCDDGAGTDADAHLCEIVYKSV